MSKRSLRRTKNVSDQQIRNLRGGMNVSNKRGYIKSIYECNNAKNWVKHHNVRNGIKN